MSYATNTINVKFIQQNTMLNSVEWKSRQIPTAQIPLSSAFCKFSNRTISAMNVECLFRNPNWNWLKKSCLLRNFRNRLYLRRSKIFKNKDNNEMGRLLQGVKQLLYSYIFLEFPIFETHSYIFLYFLKNSYKLL